MKEAGQPLNAGKIAELSGLDRKEVDAAKCISCMKCVSVCPTGTRRIGVVMNFLATQGLKKVCATRKENELYL